MQTSFTDKQLTDKDNKSSESTLRKCVHCGMCNATCPTFCVNGEELEGPRGRIYLIKDMLENKKPANKKVVKHIDSCLSCYSCMTTCPSGVNYMHLIDHGRNYVEETYKRPFFDRLFRNVLSFVLPRPKVFLALAYLSKLIKPFSFLLPTFLKNSLNLMPNKIPSKKIETQKIYKPESGKIISRVALLTGCVQRVISPEINESTIRILNRHNVEVVVMPEIECCGSLNHHLGKKDLAHQSFVKNIEKWHEEYITNGLDAIISNTSGCGTTLKDYGYIFKNDNVPTRSDVMEKLIPYIQEQTSKGIQLNHIMRHTVGLFHGQNGSRTWKQYLSKNMCIRDADLQKVNHIMDQVKKTNPVSLER